MFWELRQRQDLRDLPCLWILILCDAELIRFLIASPADTSWHKESSASSELLARFHRIPAWAWSRGYRSSINAYRSYLHWRAAFLLIPRYQNRNSFWDAALVRRTSWVIDVHGFVVRCLSSRFSAARARNWRLTTEARGGCYRWNLIGAVAGYVSADFLLGFEMHRAASSFKQWSNDLKSWTRRPYASYCTGQSRFPEWWPAAPGKCWGIFCGKTRWLALMLDVEAVLKT